MMAGWPRPPTCNYDLFDYLMGIHPEQNGCMRVDEWEYDDGRRYERHNRREFRRSSGRKPGEMHAWNRGAYDGDLIDDDLRTEDD